MENVRVQFVEAFTQIQDAGGVVAISLSGVIKVVGDQALMAYLPVRVSWPLSGADFKRMLWGALREAQNSVEAGE